MLKDWIEEKGIKECPKCTHDIFIAELSQGKIERYALRCHNCNKFLGWIPNKYNDESQKIELAKVLFEPDQVIKDMLFGARP